MREEFWLFVKQLPDREMDGPFESMAEAIQFSVDERLGLLGDIQLVRLHAKDGQVVVKDIVASTDPADLS